MKNFAQMAVSLDTANSIVVAAIVVAALLAIGYVVAVFIAQQRQSTVLESMVDAAETEERTSACWARMQEQAAALARYATEPQVVTDPDVIHAAACDRLFTPRRGTRRTTTQRPARTTVPMWGGDLMAA